MSSPFSVFIDIQDELKALLETPPVAGVGKVTLDHPWELIKPTPFAINVILDKTQGGLGGVTGSPTDWATEYVIECYARANAIEQAARVVDPLLIAVWERLYTGSAYAGLIALGVQDVLPDPAIEWDRRTGGDGPLICVPIKTRIVHRTNPARLTAWNGT